MNRRSRPTLKDILLERLLAINPRTDLPNYWGLIVVGTLVLLLPVVMSDSTLAALSLWRKGAPMDTLMPFGKIGRLEPLEHVLWFSFTLSIIFAVAISMLFIGTVAHTVHRKRRKVGDSAHP